MPTKKISEEQYAKAVSAGMNDLMGRKRKRTPQLYTKEFTAKAVAVLNESNKRSVALRKKVVQEKAIKPNSSKK